MSAAPQAAARKRERVASECICCGSTALKKSPAILMPFVAHRVFDWRPVEITPAWGLNTIQCGHAYTVCNSLCCADCGMLFLDIRFSDAELNALYRNYRDAEYTALREFYEPGYMARNQILHAGVDYTHAVEEFLAPHVPLPARVLDWGGDTGKNTPFKQQHALFHVYDISNPVVINGAELVDKATAQATGYDLIVCSNVLEHVSYPADILLDIHAAMGEHTLLYLEVPHETLVCTAPDPEQLHLIKKHWHEHINFFSEQSLRRLLDACGFALLDIKQLQVTIGEKTATNFKVLCKRSA